MRDLDKIKELCDQNGVTLLYACKFGSHLYGMNTPESDTDYKGLFLPSKEQCFTQNVSKSITYTSGENSSKNTDEDVDIQLWSLQYFLKMVSRGETNSLDLLYSFTFPEMEVYKLDIMDSIFGNHNRLFDIKSCNAYVGYAIGQAKKYGIKGSRLGVLKSVNRHVIDWIRDYNGDEKIEDIRLRSYLPSLSLSGLFDSSYCFTKKFDVNKDNPMEGLVLCGKVHMESIPLLEFYKRVNGEYKKYGNRAEEAEKNNGLDWKALSHALRALSQMKQLIKKGYIKYPLENANELKNIKLGNTTFKEVEKRILKDLKWIDETLNDPDLSVFNKKDDNLIRNIIINSYSV